MPEPEPESQAVPSGRGVVALVLYDYDVRIAALFSNLVSDYIVLGRGRQ